MRKEVCRLFLILCCCFPGRLLAQSTILTDETNAAIRQRCLVCLSGVDSSSAGRLRIQDSAAYYYHQCHMLISAGATDDAYLSAGLVNTVEKTSFSKFIHAGASFMQAKISDYRHSPETIGQYLRFLGYTRTDSVLRADAFASLTVLYIRMQDWTRTRENLYRWNTSYYSYTDTMSRAAVCNSILEVFDTASKVTNPATAVSLFADFFTKRNDTGRLMILYLKTSRWYQVHLNNAAALSSLQKAAVIAESQADYGQQKECYLQLSLLQAAAGHFKEALAYKEKYRQVIDYFPDTPVKKLVARQQKKKIFFDTTDSQATKSVTANTQAGDKAAGTINFLMLLILILLLLAGIIYRLQEKRHSRKAKQELEQLQAKNDSKDQLFSVISHDLRSAMYTLQINMGKLKTILTRNPVHEATSLAITTEQVTTSTLALLNNLLYWSLSQTGQVNYEPQTADVRALINQVTYDYLPIAKSKRVALTVDILYDITCIADINSAKLILRNLIDNAIKYTAAGGAVTVTALPLDDNCLITVKDNGVGMDQQTIAELFSSGTGRSQQDAYGRRSTGIGLWLAKTMAEKNNGRLSIASAKGVGSSITISLPAGGELLP